MKRETFLENAIIVEVKLGKDVIEDHPEDEREEYLQMLEKTNDVFSTVYKLVFECESGKAIARDFLDDEEFYREGAIPFIRRLLEVVGVEKWEDLWGAPVRIEYLRDSPAGVVLKIGNLLEEEWIDCCRFFEERLEDRNREEHEGEWVSVNDRLPEEWQEVLVLMPGSEQKNRYTVTYWNNVEGVPMWRSLPCGWSSPIVEGKVTHWMPLPEPPEGY